MGFRLFAHLHIFSFVLRLVARFRGCEGRTGEMRMRGELGRGRGGSHQVLNYFHAYGSGDCKAKGSGY